MLIIDLMLQLGVSADRSSMAFDYSPVAILGVFTVDIGNFVAILLLVKVDHLFVDGSLQLTHNLCRMAEWYRA